MVTLTGDGVLFAKNSDRDPNEAQTLRWYAAGEHPPGSTVACTWSTIAQARRTHAVLLSQPWWMWGAEMGANERGVVIGNEAVFTRRTGRGSRRTGDGDTPLLGMDLLRLGLERGATRHEAVGVILGLLDQHGQGGSCSHEHPRFSYDSSFIVADPAGATVVETAGRQWATEEVTGARSISNGLTIKGFADRHADPVRGRVASCAARRARTTRAASLAAGPLDLMRALRDHGEGPAPAYSRVNGALSAPCAHAGGLVTSTQSTASWVADLRPHRPGGRPADGLSAGGTPAGGRHWVTATSAPCTGLFKPITVTEPLTLDEGSPTNRFDPGSTWWRHERLHRTAVRDLPRALAAYGAARDLLERRWVEEPPAGAEALAQAEEAGRRWLAEVEALRLVDHRPAWVRRLWSRWGDQAGLSTAGASPEAAGRPADRGQAAS
jgi:secernin